MFRSIFCLTVALSAGGLSAQTYNESESEILNPDRVGNEAQFKEDLSAVGEAQLAADTREDLEEEEAVIAMCAEYGISQITDVQWGGRRRWICFARSPRGTFSGVSQNIQQARRNAMSRCRSNSSRCRLGTCR